MNGNDNPTIGGRFRTLSFGGVTCKTAIADEDDNEMVTNLMVVPTGTKCGEEMVSTQGGLMFFSFIGAANVCWALGTWGRVSKGPARKDVEADLQQRAEGVAELLSALRLPCAFVRMKQVVGNDFRAGLHAGC